MNRGSGLTLLLSLEASLRACSSFWHSSATLGQKHFPRSSRVDGCAGSLLHGMLVVVDELLSELDDPQPWSPRAMYTRVIRKPPDLTLTCIAAQYEVKDRALYE